MNLIALGIAGFFSGICASMGIGGGFVLMLYLTLLAGTPQKEAQLFNLCFFLPIAAFSLWRHRKNGLLCTSPIKPALLGGIPAALAGSLLAAFLPNAQIAKLFSIFLAIIGIKTVFARRESEQSKEERVIRPTQKQ